MRKILCLWLLCSVLRATTATLIETCGVETTTDDSVLDADVLHATTTEHNNRVLLEVVALSGDVSSYFHLVREANTGDLTDSRVRLTGGLRSHLHAHATLERRRVERWAVLEGVEATTKSHDLRLATGGLAGLLGELVDSRHYEMKTPPWESKALYKSWFRNATAPRPILRGPALNLSFLYNFSRFPLCLTDSLGGMKLRIASLLVAFCLLIGAYPVFADLVAPPPIYPTFENQQKLTLYIGMNGEALATSSVPTAQNLTLSYTLGYYPEIFGGSEPTPELDQYFQDSLDDFKTYLELWSGEPFTTGATPIHSFELEASKTGSVSVTLPAPGPYFIVAYQTNEVRDPATYCAKYEIPDEDCYMEGYLLEFPHEDTQTYFTLPLDHESYPDSFPMTYAGTRLTGIDSEIGASNVLFLPGIKGSRLYGGSGEKLWEPFGNQDIESLLLDATGKSLNTSVHAKPGDIVDEVAGVIDIYGSYAAFMDGLVTEGTIADWQAASYDWRLSLPDIVQGGAVLDGRLSYIGITPEPYLKHQLEELAATSNTGKVTIVAHSNGGLVAKELMRTLGDAETERLIDNVILVGVPQSGAPQALGALFYGYKEGLPWWFPGIVSIATARQFAQNSPMGYHLLPSPAYFRDVRDPDHAVVRFGAGESHAKEREAYGSIIEDFDELASFALAEEGGREAPHPGAYWHASILNPSLIDYARTIHASLDAWVPPNGVTVYQLAGWGEDTVAGIEYYEQCVFAFCTPKYRPTFVEDGDGVVPVPSALMMSESDNVKRYWIDLRKFGFGITGNKDHGNILGIEQIHSFIEEVLREEVAETSEVILTHQPENPSEDKKLYFFLHSPLSLELYDSSGNRVGPNEDGSDEEAIPNSSYGRLGEVQYIIAPSNENYRLEMHGNATGAFTLDIRNVDEDAVVASTTFANLPATAETFAVLHIENGNVDETSLKIDKDGDGSIDITVNATSQEIETYKDRESTSSKQLRVQAVSPPDYENPPELLEEEVLKEDKITNATEANSANNNGETFESVIENASIEIRAGTEEINYQPEGLLSRLYSYLELIIKSILAYFKIFI